jgi:hypothetical protein
MQDAVRSERIRLPGAAEIMDHEVEVVGATDTYRNRAPNMKPVDQRRGRRVTVRSGLGAIRFNLSGDRVQSTLPHSPD